MNETFGYDIPSDHTGEAWVISANPNGDCVISEGEYTGKTLSQLWEEHRELFGNYKSKEFPLLMKVLDSQTDLSIQVHPNDEYAHKYENGGPGKYECWYILDAKEDASIVLGHNAKTKEELVSMIENKEFRKLVKEVPVKKGEFIQIEAGLVHALKAGLMVLETQQNCSISYRVYDYDRLDNGVKRELHIKQSIDVISVPSPEDAKHVSTDDLIEELVDCKYYNVKKLTIKDSFNFEQRDPFVLVFCVDGNGTVNGHDFKAGEYFVATAGCKYLNFEGQFTLIISAPGPEEYIFVG